MRKILLLSVLLYMNPPEICAQQSWNGAWEGKLELANLRIVINIKTTDAGAVTVTMDSPDQSAFGLPVESSKINGDSIFISDSKFRITYFGKRINDSTINGVFTQGANMPLVLIRSSTGTVAKPVIKSQTPVPPLPYKTEEVTILNNKVTDTCIPEEEAFRRLQKHIHKIWKDADDKGERFFPHEYMYKMLLSGVLEQYYEIEPKNSWMLAAAKKNIPIVVPGWEDSTMGNIFASYIIKNEMKASTMKSGIEYMVWLADWYRENSGGKGVGFFQIGGGIAGDFPICVVPMMYQDLEWEGVPFWSYFCQISDSTTSYGSYSGAVPNEKITWGKLDINTPKFIVESDATIVVPLIFAWVLGW